MDKNKPQTLDEALRAINEAMIAEGANLKELIKSDYANIRTAVEDLAPRVVQQVKDATAPYVDKAREVAGPQIDFAVAGGKTVGNEFDRQMRKNPYLVLGGVALGAIALGYMFGRKKTPAPVDYTGLSYGDAPITTATENQELA